MAVYGYARVSTAMQTDEGESLGVQERQIKGWCIMQGHDPATLFVEEGVSASIALDKRPKGAALMASLKRGDIVVASRLDRLFRSPLDALQTVEKVRTKGVTIIVIDGLGDITGNGMGRAFMIIAATFAEMEREAIKTRVRDVKRDQKERGRYLGGRVPFGFHVEYDDQRNAELIPIPEEQAIITQIKLLRGRKLSLRKIREVIATDHGRNLSLDAINRLSLD